MKAKEILKKYNISRNTLTNWVKNNKIYTEKTPTGRYDYFFKTDIPNNNRKNIIYGRVSTTIQKDNLNRQVERIKQFCYSKGIEIGDVYTDIGSALNYNRSSYKKLLFEILSGEINKIIIEYKDRLLRIGFEELEYICKKFNSEIIIIDNSLYDSDKSKQKEITEDLISIIHHYSMKIYSSRKRKKIEMVIKEENDI